jgi:hypothetical protein
MIKSLSEAEEKETNDIIQYAYLELNNIMEKWCQKYEEDYKGGQMRCDRGEQIESYVKNIIRKINEKSDLNIVALTGDKDKKELKIPGTEIKKNHQVDIHIYKKDQFIAVIECKAYLDSCYYTRACDDFNLFKKFGFNVKHYIFALENSIKEETKLFTDYEKDNICDDVFYLLDGKRISSKPMYDRKYRKNINMNKLGYFINSLEKLLI